MNRGAIANVRRQTPLLLLRADPADALDLERGPAALLGDFPVLHVDVGMGRLVALEPAQQLGRHTAVASCFARSGKTAVRFWSPMTPPNASAARKLASAKNLIS